MKFMPRMVIKEISSPFPSPSRSEPSSSMTRT